jgi:hypothetical protein
MKIERIIDGQPFVITCTEWGYTPLKIGIPDLTLEYFYDFYPENIKKETTYDIDGYDLAIRPTVGGFEAALRIGYYPVHIKKWTFLISTLEINALKKQAKTKEENEEYYR